jgi:large repetitive protein
MRIGVALGAALVAAGLFVGPAAGAAIEAQIVTGPGGPTDSQTQSFTYTATGGAGGTPTFACSLDGGPFNPCPSSGNTWSGISEGSHTFSVEATVGGSTSAPVSVTFLVDITRPTTSLQSPLPEAVSSSPSASFTFAGGDGTGSGVIAFECSLDGADWSACASPDAVGSLADGRHVFEVAVVDAAGNVDADPASYGWTVDTTPPVLTWTALPPAATSRTSATLTFAAHDGPTGSGVASIDCSVDGAGFAACPGMLALSNLPQGRHSVIVRGTDEAGNVTAKTVSWLVDTTPPTARIASGPSGAVIDRSANIAFSGDDGAKGSGVASWTCSLDGGETAACTSPLTLAGLAGGAHEVQVVAIDQAGNAGVPVTLRWVVVAPRPTGVARGAPGPVCLGTRGLLMSVQRSPSRSPSVIVLKRNLNGARIVGAKLLRPSRAVVVRHLVFYGLLVGVALTGRPKGKYVVRVSVRLRSGHVVTATREVTAC